MLKDSAHARGMSARVANSPATAGRQMRANFRIASPQGEEATMALDDA